MSRSPHRTFARCCSLLGLTAALSSCVDAGTPLPEPPDELPRPDYANLFSPIATPTTTPTRPSVSIVTNPGAVQPGTQVWIINLDNADAPVQATADDQGAFQTGPIAIDTNERLRIVSRSERAHSAPLDLFKPAAVDSSMMPPPPPLARLEAGGLTCLRMTPAQTLTLQARDGRLKLDNQCGVALAITRAALRLGDQGIRISAAPTQLGVGASGLIQIADELGPGTSERLDIVLLDIAAADGRSGRYALDVFSDLE